MYCAGPFIKFVVCDMPTIEKNASSVPGLFNGKWPTSLGQLEEQLKKLVSAFPITMVTNARQKISRSLSSQALLTILLGDTEKFILTPYLLASNTSNINYPH